MLSGASRPGSILFRVPALPAGSSQSEGGGRDKMQIRNKQSETPAMNGLLCMGLTISQETDNKCKQSEGGEANVN